MESKSNQTNKNNMKIVVINGSPRKNGATATLLKTMVKHLEEKGNVDVQYINIMDYSLLSCTGCMSCYHNGVCHLKDGVEEINGMIAQADGLIIGSPTYSSSMPGSLKTFIDRGHFVLEQALVGKYTFALNTYEIAGGGNVISGLKTLYQYSGGILSGSHICKLPFNTDPLSKSGKVLLKKTDKFYNSVKSTKGKSLINRIINFIALYIIIKPQVLKRPKQYKAVIERWKKLGICK
ncbi:flavodoxin family protein [Dysgonomonas sp. 521]|nr:multimeric flavodoxin WrbA [Dysgonomonas sp. PF1-14]NDV93599.1 flavodoxin family protein [Dysgonomonas sp. 521]